MDAVPSTPSHDPDLLDELHAHLAEHTPSCNAYVDALLSRAAVALARLAESGAK